MRENLLRFMAWVFRVPYHPPAPGPFDRSGSRAVAPRGTNQVPPATPRVDRVEEGYRPHQ